VTTAGVIAVGNLEAQINGQISRGTRGQLTVGERAELVELLALRGHVLGRVADAEQAATLADELAGQVPGDARSLVARARMSGVFHRFAPALTDLDTAAALELQHCQRERGGAAVGACRRAEPALRLIHLTELAEDPRQGCQRAEVRMTVSGRPADGERLVVASECLVDRGTVSSHQSGSRQELPKSSRFRCGQRI
jgi:hypothetical protein